MYAENPEELTNTSRISIAPTDQLVYAIICVFLAMRPILSDRVTYAHACEAQFVTINDA